MFSEMSENLRAYKVNQHQHMPEIIQEIEHVTRQRVRLGFVPQVIPVRRGLISMLYLQTAAEASTIEQAYQARYTPSATPFVRVRSNTLPQLRDVVGTNYCDIGFVSDRDLGTLIIASAIDNLLKGAAGQAIQNFNVMHGFPETTGLR